MATTKGRALIILAEGAEEMETVITADVLRRGKVDTTIAGLNGEGPVQCSRKVVVKPDLSLEDAHKLAPFDAVILPGGLGGAERLGKSQKVKSVLQEQEKADRIIAAICAGPTALAAHGIGVGKALTSYPSVKDKFKDYKYSEDRVCIDGKLITSRAPGTAFEFAIEIVRAVRGDDGVADGLAAPMLLQ
ncbi:Parkinson disease protein 7 homolog [Xenia sp. Carnegie-2017]|uniref:Parkinson disease protein 7 homolog n=1 Tax=Xenia sp. Carnegie-2017 TaxID=2897299 RepID=UPI001F0434E5|nr:Parkinson disease protein 7 homolog [Xenia sp. Carnegie-2017]XP_046849202.1 Parkinson disease protein 7 homolog [Xenia sp. Carnegie-2017]XP_046849203.1 Parkinson disease protein 7 homolog [Xenia sp. Carnegie-2017]